MPQTRHDMQQQNTGIISPLIRYFRDNNMMRDFDDFACDRVAFVTLPIPNPLNYQQPIYFAPQNILDGENCTITAISVVPLNELGTAPDNRVNPSTRSTLTNGVLYIANLRREIIAELPLEQLIAPTIGETGGNEGKPCLTWFNSQVWQNCYVQFTTTGTPVNEAIMFTIHYRTREKN